MDLPVHTMQMSIIFPKGKVNRGTLQSVFVYLQKVVQHEDIALTKKATDAIGVVQQKLQDLEILVGTDRMKAIVTRLSNAGSSQDGSVYATRLNIYENKVIPCNVRWTLE